MEAILLGIQGFIPLMAIIFGIIIIRKDKQIYADKDFGRPFLDDDDQYECHKWGHVK